MIEAAGNCLYFDDSLPVGVVRSETCRVRPNSRKHLDVFMHVDTHAVLWLNGGLPRAFEMVASQPAGTFEVPLVPVDMELAEEVAMSLSMTDPEPSSVCVYVPCLQDAVVERDGFHLCQGHADLMASWDALVA